MAISGLWKAGQGQSGALKWGTGFNPVHRIMTEGPPLRSSEVPTGYGPGAEMESVPEVLTSQEELGFEEIESHALWGYGPDTGTDTRPSLGEDSEITRGSTPPGFPDMGDLPEDTRDTVWHEKQLGDSRDEAKLGFKEETVSEGWENKTVTSVLDAKTSDPNQYEMQTSMTQRDKVREGSQAQAGRASEHLAPIGSYRPTWGMRRKPWSQGRRNYDMYPRQQDDILRPFLYRTAGTGSQEWMAANEATQYQRNALQRQPVPDPYAGSPTPQPGNVYEEESSDVSTWVDVWY
jgi:hypothetical protein